MSKRKPPYQHNDGSGCWTRDCSLRQAANKDNISYEEFYPNSPQAPQKVVLPSDIAEELQKKYDVSLSFTSAGTPGYVNLNHIAIPKNQRNQGVGSAVMRKLTEAADQNSWTVALTPSDLFGSNVRRLEVFYRQFGFVISRDKSTTETMIRYPQ